MKGILNTHNISDNRCKAAYVVLQQMSRNRIQLAQADLLTNLVISSVVVGMNDDRYDINFVYKIGAEFV